MGVVPLIFAVLGTFLLSVAAGGLIGRQINSQRPIAVAQATPSSAAPTAANAPPATVAVSTSSATPVATPIASPSAAPVPTPTPTPTPTPLPTSSVVPTATPLDPPTAQAFAADLDGAIAAGDDEYLFSRLHPVVIERYDARQCRSYVQGIQRPVAWQIESSSGPVAWDYVTDGQTTTIADATTVTVREPGATPEVRELHFAAVDGAWRWFTDCGDPS